MTNSIWFQRVGNGLIEHREDKSTLFHPLLSNDKYLSTDNDPNRSTNGGDTDAPGNDDSSTGVVTADMINAAVKGMGHNPSDMVYTADEIADMFTKAIATCYSGKVTKNMLAVMVGECCEESAGFAALKEYGGSSKSYAPYYGRGFIQLTHQANYAAFGQYLQKKGIVSDRSEFVNNPDMVATKDFAALTAAFYFNNTFGGRTLWEVASSDTDPWYTSGNCINRGSAVSSPPPYGASDRANAIRACLAVTPDPTVTPGTGSNNATCQKMLQAEIGMIGTLAYTEGAGRLGAYTSGSTDCSGLQWAVYKHVAGIDLMQNGTAYTGNMSQEGTKVVYYGSAAECKSAVANGMASKLAVGDLVFFDWGPAVTSTYDHVEMYAGIQTDYYGTKGPATIGHGGTPHMGPTIKNLDMHMKESVRVMVRRYIKQ